MSKRLKSCKLLLSSIDVSRTKSSACPVNSYGVQKDCEEDMQKYRKAAEQGDADAQNSMGDLYYWGRGVLRDYKEAMKWYRKAAEQGNTDAQYKIGNLYCFGQGVMTDYQEAMKWYRKAADQDSADAQNIIGYLYECGNGVEQDYQEALKWYRKASEHGNDSAKRKLVWLQKNLSNLNASPKKSSRSFINEQQFTAFERWIYNLSATAPRQPN
ncbi:tetratricopeptide repeat protein [Mitsuokella jalaludinii]|uniref:tetratricopeptide repeat protein n=1 Tax=Mitsuokella jalaludinii TaxID=187979 RepID=UPI003F8C4BF5